MGSWPLTFLHLGESLLLSDLQTGTFRSADSSFLPEGVQVPSTPVRVPEERLRAGRR